MLLFFKAVRAVLDESLEQRRKSCDENHKRVD